MKGAFKVSRRKDKTSSLLTSGRFGHIHTMYELYYLISGEVQYFVSTSTFTLKAGDIVVIPPNVIHKTVYSHNANMERLLINFSDEVLQKDALYLLEDLKPLHISISSDFKQKIQDTFLKIEDENCADNFGKDSLLTSYLTEILVQINRYQNTFKSQRSNITPATKVINQCAKYIADNCSSDINLATISKMAAMSESYFSREFKKNTGFGFNEYLVMNRLLTAQKLLCTTTLPISTIATKCGFNDSNYFAAVFKKEYGITPYKYKKINSK